MDPFEGTTAAAAFAEVVPMDCDVYVIGLQVRCARVRWRESNHTLWAPRADAACLPALCAGSRG